MREVGSWLEVGQRVAAARAAAGLTQEHAAARAGLERTALAKVERGQRQLSAIELSRLASALDRPLDWFVLESAPAVVSRRADLPLDTPSARSLDDLLEDVTRDVELLEELALLDDPGERASRPRPRSFQQAEDAANQVRQLLQVDRGPLGDLQQLTQRLGLLAFVLDVEPAEADGAYVALEDWGVALINGRRPSGRRRFTLVHELGHHLFADAYATDWSVGEETTEPERLINAFAAYLLLPRADAIRRWQELNGPQYPRTAAIRLALEYRMSWSALCSQLRNCGLVDQQLRDLLVGQPPHRSDYLELGIGPTEDLSAPSVPSKFAHAVLNGYRTYGLGETRTIELLRGTLGKDELPDRSPLPQDTLLEEVGPSL